METKRSSLFGQFLDRTSKLSNADFSISGGEVFFRNPGSIAADPQILFRLFAFLAQNDVSLAADTEEYLERSIAVFRSWVENHRSVWAAFRDILCQPHALRALGTMRGCGALFALFPELRDSDGQAMPAVQSVLDLRARKDGPLAELAAGACDPELLIAALLFYGAATQTVAESALRRAGITDREWGIVSFLIASQHEMAAVISGRDLSDPATIREMAAKAGTVERLKLLTLLTYADISSAQPSDTTPWREELLLSLYSQTYAALTRELGLRITQHDASVNPDLQQFLEGMPARYLRTHSEHEIHEHLQLEREGGWKGVGVSLDRSTAWSLTVVASDRPSLFASIAAALSSYGFNILKAEAFSNKRGTAIETFRFADPAHLLELNSAQAQEFTKTVIQAVKGEISVADLLKRRPKVKPDAKALAASRVNFDNQASPSATLIELVAHDRPGLLCDVASAIAKRGGNIEVLLVDTAANRAMDVLYVTKRGAKLNDQEAGEMAKAIAAINAV